MWMSADKMAGFLYFEEIAIFSNELIIFHEVIYLTRALAWNIRILPILIQRESTLTIQNIMRISLIFMQRVTRSFLYLTNYSFFQKLEHSILTLSAQFRSSFLCVVTIYSKRNQGSCSFYAVSFVLKQTQMTLM